MSSDEKLDMGNRLTVERGGLYGKRTWRDLSAPRQRRLPDVSFDKQARSVFASWKANGGNGPYASRAIANAAQSLQFPLRQVQRDIADAIEADVPLHLVERAGELLIDEARRLHAVKMGKRMERPEPPAPSGGAMPRPMSTTGEFQKAA